MNDRDKLKNLIAKDLKEREEYSKNKKAFHNLSQNKKVNMMCYCGSEKKYKKCCYWRELREEEERE